MWVVVYKNVGLLANMHVKLRELGNTLGLKKICAYPQPNGYNYQNCTTQTHPSY